MISVQLSDIPDYLLNSAFYLSLDNDEGNQEAIQIPERCFKENDKVINLDDFGQLLHTMQFWGVDVIPCGMIEFLQHSPCLGWEPVAKAVLDPKSPLLDDLRTIYGPSTYSKTEEIFMAERFVRSIRKNRSELLTFWLDKGWYNKQMKYNGCDITDFAAKFGSLLCLQILLGKSFPVTHKTASSAAEYGHMECLRFLHDNNCPWDNSVLFEAAGGGYLDILEYAHQQGCMLLDEIICTMAARNGHLHCLQYAHEHGCPWTDEVTEEAVFYGHIECLRYALEHDGEVSYYASEAAAERGRLDCLQLLYQFNAPWNSCVSSMAARCGHLHILQYLHEHHCPWDASVFDDAVLGGHLDCLQYAHSQGLTLPTERYELCKWATERGHLDILDYLYENGCTVLWHTNRPL